MGEAAAEVFAEPGKEKGMQRKKVLLAEGDELLRKEIIDLLQFECECVSVGNGVEGLSYMEKHPGEIDLIISELSMPMMDGLEMIGCIYENPVNKVIPVLVITMPDKEEEIQKAFEAGVDDVLIRPFEPDIVKKRVKNMLYISDARNIHNVMEDLVRVEIEENIDTLGICPCPICQRDLLTLTLNHVAPKYVSTERGAIVSKVGGMSRTERIKLLAEIAQYAQMVKEKPRHPQTTAS